MRITMTTMIILGAIIGLVIIIALVLRYGDFTSGFGSDFADMANKLFGGL